MTKKTIKQTSEKIGQAIARSTYKVESAGKMAQNKVEKVAQNMSQKAKDFMDNMTKPIEDISSQACPFRINEGNSLEGQIGETAGAVYDYLLNNQQAPTSRLVNAIMRQKHTKANTYAAIGWLMREAKLEFSADGETVKLRN